MTKCPNAPDPRNMAIDATAAIFANNKHIEHFSISMTDKHVFFKLLLSPFPSSFPFLFFFFYFTYYYIKFSRTILYTLQKCFTLDEKVVYSLFSRRLRGNRFTERELLENWSLEAQPRGTIGPDSCKSNERG